jgi:hypothetical protein
MKFTFKNGIADISWRENLSMIQLETTLTSRNTLPSNDQINEVWKPKKKK